MVGVLNVLSSSPFWRLFWMGDKGAIPLPENISQYLEAWQRQATSQGLSNPLVKMPLKRFRALAPAELATVAAGSPLIIGTTAEPICRNLLKNFKTHIRERGEHCAFVSHGVAEIAIAAGIGQQPRNAIFPIFLRRAQLGEQSERIRVSCDEEEPWTFNPVLEANLRAIGIYAPSSLCQAPNEGVNWIAGRLANRGRVSADAYVGLFSNQQMVV
jgi:hypothetical protein